LVKIYSRIIRKRYFGRRTYEYRHISIPVPSRFHKQLEPFLNQNLEITVAGDTDRVIITLLSPMKTVLHDENTPAKTPQSSRLQPEKQH
jgi:hypothetical protein